MVFLIVFFWWKFFEETAVEYCHVVFQSIQSRMQKVMNTDAQEQWGSFSIVFDFSRSE